MNCPFPSSVCHLMGNEDEFGNYLDLKLHCYEQKTKKKAQTAKESFLKSSGSCKGSKTWNGCFIYSRTLISGTVIWPVLQYDNISSFWTKLSVISLARLGEIATQPSLSISNIRATDYVLHLKSHEGRYVASLQVSAWLKELAFFDLPFWDSYLL